MAESESDDDEMKSDSANLKPGHTMADTDGNDDDDDVNDASMNS